VGKVEKEDGYMIYMRGAATLHHLPGRVV
jgi:hypothetical protein